MKFLKKFTNALVAISLVFASLVMMQGAEAVASCTTPGGAADQSLVICSDSGTFTARAPISSAGIIAQEIIMNIDPAKTTLTSTNQIVAPAGWTLSYYNGTAWSSTTPANPAAWALVSKVKASGTITSMGSANGRQIATNSATAVSPPSGSFSAAGAGDGWSVFFDNNNHVFNIFHHDGPQRAIDCHTRTGASCGSGWPFMVSPYHTNGQSEGWVDNTNKHLWWETNSSTATGFGCVDLTNIATPTWCGGTATTGFVQTGTSAANNYGYTGNLAVAGSRLFTWESGTGKLMCVDTALNNGRGAACANQPISFTGITSAPQQQGQALLNYDGKIYGTAQNKAVCLDPYTFQICSTFNFTLPNNGLAIFPLPNSSGSIIGLCYITRNTNPCYDLTGASMTRPSSLTLTTNQYFTHYGKNPEIDGSRVYWADSWIGAQVYCWDAALNNGAGALCANWPIAVYKNYTIQIDPENKGCLWTNGDDGIIRTFDALLGTLGCTSLPRDVTFDANLIIPRMGCNPTTSITAWQDFRLTGPASGKYATATLTVTKADGSAIAGFTAVPITTGTGRVIDLSGLSVADSGQKPLFKVNFTQRTGTTPADDATASVTAIGDQPELCITPSQQYVCPSTLGPLNNLTAQTAGITASGSATLSGNNTQNFIGASTNINLTTPALSVCASTLSGNAAGAGGGAPVSGASVSLLDSSGNAVLGSNSQPMTTVTDIAGNYSFGTLALGTYKVRFADKSVTMTVSTASISSGGNGVTNASSGSATSGAVVLAANTNGTVDAAYALPPSTPSRTQIALANTNVVFDPFAMAPASMTSGDDQRAFASTGSNFASTLGLTKLCSPSETPNSCTSTTVSTANGSYAVNATTGAITFTPNVGFVGTAPTVSYVVTDAAARSISGTLTAIIASPSSANNDHGYSRAGNPQTIYPIANDIASTGNSLVSNTLFLCGVGQTSPNCNQTSLTVTGEGTYSVSSGGIVTFQPGLSFLGDGSPINYQVTDFLGAVVTASITAHVVAPAPPTSPSPTATATASPTATPSATPSPTATTQSSAAKPDFKSGTAGTPLTISPLLNDEGTTGTLSLCELGSQPTDCTAKQFATAQGNWVANNNGTVTFAPKDNFFGRASIGYRATLSTGAEVWSFITVTIPKKPALAYTGGGDQQALIGWMFGFLIIGTAMLSAAGHRQRRMAKHRAN